MSSRAVAGLFLTVSVFGVAACTHGADSAPPNAQAVFAFTHVNVIPMDSERVLRDQTVLTRGPLIVSVGPARATAIPPGATVVDGHNAYLMPGLTDMHVHLYESEELLSDLVWGVTTVASFSGGPRTLRWRAAVREGRLVGPTIYTTAPILDGAPPINPTHIEVATVAEAKTVVDFEKRDGYDFVKVYNNLSPDVYRAILREAKIVGLPVAGHIVRSVGAEESLRDGQRVIAHAEEYFFSYFHAQPDTARIPAIVAQTKAADAWVIAMLSSTPDFLGVIASPDSEISIPEGQHLPPAIFEAYRPANNGYVNRPNIPAFVSMLRTMAAFLPRLVKALNDAQVRLLVGTDATSSNFPGWGVHVEIRDLVAAGLTPYQALRAATYNAGAFVAQEIRSADHFGVVAPGMRADLILLSANPLTDITNIDSLSGVMARGQWWPIDSIRRVRDRRVAPYPPLKVFVARFDSLVTAHRLREARAVFDSAVRADSGEPPFHPYMLYGDGLDLLKSDPAGAAEFMRMGVELYPDGFETHNGLGLALLGTHDTTEARVEFLTAAGLAPGNDASIRMLDSLDHRARHR